MRLKPNLGKTARVIYVGVGLALIIGSLVIGLEGWARLILLVVGGGSIAAGAIGW